MKAEVPMFVLKSMHRTLRVSWCLTRETPFSKPHDARRSSASTGRSYAELLSNTELYRSQRSTFIIQEPQRSSIAGQVGVEDGWCRERKKQGCRMQDLRWGTSCRTSTVMCEAVYAVCSRSTVALRQYELPRRHRGCARVECAPRIGVCETLYFDLETSACFCRLKAFRRSTHGVPTWQMSPSLAALPRLTDVHSTENRRNVRLDTRHARERRS
ncbi:hypothetical protein BV25DRAFT_1034680 [Artomyces pyxidatus]|uniref:Uncharacterized protein n=1 Tax=Artomyces pyxidatus TaxID=48021 RepID=A0ACB8SVH0_9AGAM|nr:hypothetical protein BV25DRAFT_1034680 [Artomyces pyxidatus]